MNYIGNFLVLLGLISIPAFFANASEALINQGVSEEKNDVAVIPESDVVPKISTPVISIISHQKEYYHGWPTVAAGSGGTLHLTYSGGRRYHVCPFGRIEYMISKDGGESWSWPRTITDSLTDDRDSGVVETKNGILLTSFFTSTAYQKHMNEPERLLKKVFGDKWDEEHERWLKAELPYTQEERREDVGYWLARSTDGGKTWSARYRCIPGYSPHGPVALENGDVFYAAADGKNAAAWVSKDDGLSWEKLADIPTRAGELAAIEASNGTLIVHVRDKVKVGDKTVQRTLQTESEDGGKNWSEPRYVTDGYPSHLVRLKDGTILLTYGSRTRPFGIRAKISKDNGASWSKEFLVTSDAANWDLGYPSTAQNSDGSLVTIWYETPADSHLAQLRQAKWRLQEN